MTCFNALGLGCGLAMAAFLASGTAQAGWHHNDWDGPGAGAWAAPTYPPNPAGFLPSTPYANAPVAVVEQPGPIVMYAQPVYYGPRNYGAIRYNRPCFVSDGRFSYAVSCGSLADHGFIHGYNGR